MGAGAPLLLALQVGTGGSRPNEDGSRWEPFTDNNGASGHTFTGAIPFLVGAQMTESRFWKGVLVAGSFLTGWSRINDDAHYLSQVLLGWTVAWMSVEAVGGTEGRFFAVPGGLGFAAEF